VRGVAQAVPIKTRSPDLTVKTASSGIFSLSEIILNFINPPWAEYNIMGADRILPDARNNIVMSGMDKYYWLKI
jgi:hypothetical protein